MPDNKYQVLKRILNENNVESMSDEQFAKLLENEKVNGDGSQNLQEDVAVDFLNGGCGICCC